MEQKRYFISSGFSSAEKEELRMKLNTLNGILFDVDRFPSNMICTLLYKQLVNTEKLLSACVLGTWVLKPQFVEDSFLHQCWQSEEAYESSVGCCTEDKVWLEAVTRWRRHRKNAGCGPFSNWIVLTLIHDKKLFFYHRILIQGGATVINDHKAFNNKLQDGSVPVTHIFVDELGYISNSKTNHHLFATDVVCLTPSYIKDYLLLQQLPSVEEYVIGFRKCSIRLEHLSAEDIVSAECNVDAFLCHSDQTCTSNLRFKSQQSLPSPASFKVSLIRMSCDTTMELPPTTRIEPYQSAARTNTRIRVVHGHPVEHQLSAYSNEQSRRSVNRTVSSKMLPVQCTDVNKHYEGPSHDRIFAPAVNTDAREVSINPSHILLEQQKTLLPTTADQQLLSTITGKNASDMIIDVGIKQQQPMILPPATDLLSPDTSVATLISQKDKTERSRPTCKHKLDSSIGDCGLPSKQLRADVFQSKSRSNLFSIFHSKCVLPDLSLNHVVDDMPLERNLEEHSTAFQAAGRSSKLVDSKASNTGTLNAEFEASTDHIWKSNRIIRASSRNIISEVVNCEKTESRSQCASDVLKRHGSIVLPINETKLNALPSLMSESEHIINDLASCVHYPLFSDVYKVVMFLYSLPSSSVTSIDKMLTLVNKSALTLHRFLDFLRSHSAHPVIAQHLFITSVSPGPHILCKTSGSSGVHWDHLHYIFSVLLEGDAKHSVISQTSFLCLLHYYITALEIDLEAFTTRCTVNSDVTLTSGSCHKSKRCLLSKWLWSGRCSSVKSSSFHDLLSIFVKCVAASGHKCQMELIAASQHLICMAAECCHCDNPKQFDVVNDVYPGTRIFAFCSYLADHLHGLTSDQLQVALSALSLDWLALHESCIILDHFVSSGRTRNTQTMHLSLKTIMLKYFNARTLEALSSAANSKLIVETAPQKEKDSRICVYFSEDVNKKNAKGEGKLHIACRKNNLGKVRSLLHTSGVDVNIQDNAGWAPLHEACASGHIEVVKELMKFRPKQTIESYFKPGNNCKKVNLSIASADGTTPLHDAITSNHIDIALLLIANGGEHLLDIKDAKGITPRNMASTDMWSALSCTSSQAANLLMSPLKHQQQHSSLPESSSSPNAELIFVSSSSVQKYLVLIKSLVERYLHIRAQNNNVFQTDVDDLDTFDVQISHLEKYFEQLTGGKLESNHRSLLFMLRCCADVC